MKKERMEEISRGDLVMLLGLAIIGFSSLAYWFWIFVDWVAKHVRII